MGALQQGADAIKGRWLTIPRTLSFIVNGDRVLLMKRSPHKRVFPNQYNGLGGHIERDEDPLSSAKREVREESGLDVDTLKLRAIHHIDAGETTGIILFVFVGYTQHIEVTSDEREGTLEWIPIAQLSQYDLVEDLPLILPRYLDSMEQPPLFVHVSYDERDQIIMRYADFA